MKSKIVGIVVLMLLATTVVSATTLTRNTTIPMATTGPSTVHSNNIASYEPGLFDWGVDQKQTKTSKYGITLIPPEINAQSFTPTKDKLTAVSLWIFKHATPPEPVHITMSIRSNLSGPDLATKTIDTSKVTISSKGTWVMFDFDDISTTPETVYYILCSGDAGDATNAYCWLYSANETYARGDAWYKASAGSSWIKWPSGPINPADFCFKTYYRRPLGCPVLATQQQMRPAAYGADVPVWKVGDSWTLIWHETQNKYYTNRTLWYSSQHNCTMTFTITDVTGGNYTEKWTSKDNEGRATIGSYRLKFTPLTKYTGENVFRKTDLACWHEYHQEKGLVLWMMGKIGVPFPVQYTHATNWLMSTPEIYLPFPMTAGTVGTFSGYRASSQEKSSLYWGLIKLFDFPMTNYTGSAFNYKVEMANITVPAGTYNAYNVSIDSQYGLGHFHCWRYYVPDVGYQAKMYIYGDWNTYGDLGTIYSCELVSTTYTP